MSRSLGSRAAARRPGRPSPPETRIDTLLAEAEQLLSSSPRRALQRARRAGRLTDALDASLRRRLQGLAARLVGHALKALERHEEALESYAESRACFLRAGDRLEAARTRIGHVDALMYLDRYDEARRLGRQALREFQSLGERGRAGRLLTNLGNLEYRRDRPLPALRLYGKARAMLAGRTAPRDLAVVDFNIANILAQLERLPEAERAYTSSRNAAAAAGDDLLVLHADYALAGVDAARGRYAGALRRLADCEERFDGLGHARGRCNCLLDRAEAYRRLHLNEDSAHAAEQAHAGFQRLGLRMEEARALFLAGLGTLRSGDAPAGRRFLNRARKRFLALGNPVQAAATDLRRIQAEGALGLERTARGDRDRLSDARGTFRAAGFGTLAVEAALELARLELRRGERARAARMLGSQRRSIDARRDPELSARWHHLKGLLAERDGEVAAAADHAIEAIRRLSGVREALGTSEFMTAHFWDHRRLYQDALRLVARAGKDDPPAVFEALAHMESASLHLRPGGGGQRGVDRELETLREDILRLRRELRAVLPSAGSSAPTEARLRRLQRAEREYVERLRRKRAPRGAHRGTGVRSSTLAALQSRLQEGDLWIQPVDQGTHVAFLLATRRTARLTGAYLPKRTVFDHRDDIQYQMERIRMEAAYVERRAAMLRDAAERSLERAADALLPPLRSELEGAGRILIRAGAGVELLPWGAFPLDGNVLWERAAVRVVPDLHGLGPRSPQRGDGVASRPVLWGVSDPDLAATTPELEAVAGVFPGARRFLGPEATRASFLEHARDASLIHFAGHGTFRRDNPLFSSLRFADGELLFLDLEEIRLRARLVVVSACRTGGGRAELALGIGLSRGFLGAGARALLATQWLLGDAAASAFMASFYGRLAGGELPEAALRRTALDLRRGGAHPADWAVFQLLGG